MEIISFQAYLRKVLPNAPSAMPHERFLKYMKKLNDAKAREYYELYKQASMRGIIKREYDVRNRIYDSREPQLSQKRMRARNRRLFKKAGLVTEGDGREIHHIDGDTNNNNPANLKVISSDAHRCVHNSDAPSCEFVNREQIERIQFCVII